MPTDRTDQHVAADMRTIFHPIQIGATRHDPIRLAYRHCHEWQTYVMPVRDTERGGSSSPVEVEERVEDRRVAMQAARDERLLDELVPAFEAEIVLAAYAGRVTPELAEVARMLAEVISRCVRVVDHDKLTTDECRSCARHGKVGHKQYQGHKGVAVYEKAKRYRLCRYCYDAWRADKRLPPIDILDIYHTRGPRAAGVEWAKRRRIPANA